MSDLIMKDWPKESIYVRGERCAAFLYAMGWVNSAQAEDIKRALQKDKEQVESESRPVEDIVPAGPFKDLRTLTAHVMAALVAGRNERFIVRDKIQRDQLYRWAKEHRIVLTTWVEEFAGRMEIMAKPISFLPQGAEEKPATNKEAADA